MSSGRFQIAVSGTTTLLLDTHNGNVYIPVKGKDELLVWKPYIKGDALRRDRVSRPLRTMPLEEVP